ncbi:MAG: NUDIX domain-containing protein [Patescibacteria group bacterium]
MNNPKVIPGVHLIFRKKSCRSNENEYLLHQRQNTKYFDSYFSVPGGHIDGFETPIECAIREAMEELAVEVKPENLRLVNTIYRVKKDVNEIRIDFCYLIREYSGEIIAAEPEKHSQPKWYLISELPNQMVPYIQKAIIDIENGRHFTKSEV